MRNPLESEDMAFRYVLGALVYFGAIVAGASIATWLGLVAFVLASAVAIYLIRGGGLRSKPPSPAEDPPMSPAAVADTFRVVVLLAEPAVGPRLREALVELTSDVPEDVLLLHRVPGGARRDDVDEVLAEAASDLAETGVSARAESFAGGPVDAVEDVLERAPADALIVSVPSSDARWVRDGVPDAVRERFAGPVRVVAEHEDDR